jgi:hypothetical protein
MATLGPASCCCSVITCPEFFECAPGPCIKLPRMSFVRSQRVESSACTMQEQTLTLTLKDVILEFNGNPADPCYQLVSGKADVNYTTSVWGIFGTSGGAGGTLFDIGDGDCCPDCLECCQSSETTFVATDRDIGGSMSLCCYKPCGATSQPVLKLEFDGFVYGDWTYKTYDTTQGAGCCEAPMVVTGPIESFLELAFRAYTPLTCTIASWFSCRWVDFGWGDNQGKNGTGWSSGRISGSTGGNPLDAICSGEYAFERPGCLEDGEGYPTITAEDCLKAGFGTMRTHYDVCSCELTNPLGPGGTALVKNRTCIDSDVALGGGAGTCCARLVSCCSDGTKVTGTDPDCPTITGSATPCLIGCPDPCCNNTAGLLSFIYRCDREDSSFDQATVVTCPPPPEE